jgi:transcriptional regulator of heat shock response
MNNAKLIAKLRSLMEKADNADKKHIKKLRKILQKLKDRQHELEECLEQTSSPDRQAKIRQEIDVIRLQRGKGALVYQQIKAERKSRKEQKAG